MSAGAQFSLLHPGGQKLTPRLATLPDHASSLSGGNSITIMVPPSLSYQTLACLPACAPQGETRRALLR